MSAASRTGRRTTAPAIETDDADALSRAYEYYDPIYTLPAEGQQWWHNHGAESTSVPASHGVHA